MNVVRLKQFWAHKWFTKSNNFWAAIMIISGSTNCINKTNEPWLSPKCVFCCVNFYHVFTRIITTCTWELIQYYNLELSLHSTVFRKWGKLQMQFFLNSDPTRDFSSSLILFLCLCLFIWSSSPYKNKLITVIINLNDSNFVKMWHFFIYFIRYLYLNLLFMTHRHYHILLDSNLK